MATPPLLGGGVGVGSHPVVPPLVGGWARRPGGLGNGTTCVNASNVVDEWVDGGWGVATNRNPFRLTGPVSLNGLVQAVRNVGLHPPARNPNKDAGGRGGGHKTTQSHGPHP